MQGRHIAATKVTRRMIFPSRLSPHKEHTTFLARRDGSKAQSHCFILFLLMAVFELEEPEGKVPDAVEHLTIAG
jgi:hypothetical protein